MTTKFFRKTFFTTVVILFLSSLLELLGASSFLIFRGFGTKAVAQTISYIIPDIGSPAQNTYIEIIGPYNQDTNFGADGIYPNNSGDAVRVVCVNNADTNKIKIGPVVVSWSGKLISTQIFVMPWVNANSTDWQLLSPAFQIPLQVLLNGSNATNTDMFYIVQPQPAINTSGALILGNGGAGGIRSRRGAMIVSDFILNSGAAVTVSSTDCDPVSAGNQGFLPIHLISRGTVFVDNGASVSVNAPGGQNTDGAVGGGGGGTESFTNCSPGAGGVNHSGAGFTGGGTELLEGEQPGEGSGSTPPACAIPGNGGIALNGALGGKGQSNCNSDQGGGGGGTGHPFGYGGGKDGQPGGYGGGSGFNGYGGGGFASDGTTPATVEFGKANGNMQSVPFAGGSGGGAGVAGPGTNRGGGGGGGGAASFHAYFSSTLSASGTINANGGNGVVGCGGYRGGGGGSGGGIELGGKLNSIGAGTISVSGGNGGVGGGGAGGTGGAGRVRVDGPFATNPTINPVPGINSSSSYNGPSTDTSRYVARSFNLTGTGNGQAIRIYLKPITKPWQLVTTVTGYGTAWSQNIVLPCPDDTFLIAVAQEVLTPSVTQYTMEPAWVFSQAGANFLFVKNILKVHAGVDFSICPGTCDTIGGAPSATGGILPYAYQWAPTSGLNNATNANPIACLTANSSYTLTVTDSSGCFKTDTVDITMFPVPIAKFSFANVCVHEPMDFHDSSTVSGGAITNWSWNFGDASPLGTTPNPSHIYLTPGTFSVTLIITSNNGCLDTITKNVVVHPLPVAKYTSSNVCDGIVVQFADASTILATDTIQTWRWDFGDGSSLSTNQNTSHLYAAPGFYPVQLFVTSNFGCQDSITKTSVVNPNPIVNFTANDTAGCGPLCIIFQNTSSILTGFNTQWLWNFEDGSPTNNSQSDVHHCYKNDSLFSVVTFSPVLTVVSDSGCSTTKTKNNYITVYPNPNASFGVQPQTTIIIDPVISIINLSVGATVWNWNFGDTTTSSIQHPLSHTYKDTGTYHITLIVSNQYSCFDTAYQTIIVDPDFIFYIPNAFTPDGDGTNDAFTGKGIFIKEFEMSIYDRWGNFIFFTDDIKVPWDGKANHGAEIAQRDVYVYVVVVTDYKNKKHNYRGIVTLVR